MKVFDEKNLRVVFVRFFSSYYEPNICCVAECMRGYTEEWV